MLSSTVISKLNTTINISAILILVGLKIFFDLILHIKEHYTTISQNI